MNTAEPDPEAGPPANAAENAPVPKSPKARPAIPKEAPAEAEEPEGGAEAAAPEPAPRPARAKPVARAAAPAPGVQTGESEPGDHAAAPRHKTGNKLVFGLSALGLVAGLVAAYLFGTERKAQPPVFPPVSSPYDSAIFANGIIESDQASGENITKVLVHAGQVVSAGTPLVAMDDSVQQATTAQLQAQAAAALALLDELRAEPRRETLAITEAQVVLAETNLKVVRDQYDKDRAAYDLDPKAISKDVLDTAEDAASQAAAALEVARRQNDLTKAGAWSYDIANQQKVYDALVQAHNAAAALLVKFVLMAPVDGVVLTVNGTVGGYVSSPGVFDTYTQGLDPVVVMGTPQQFLAVRCFVDEILVSKLPTAFHIQAQMTVLGSDAKVPLEFVRVEPYVSPKIELSNQRQEQVDLRVLPVIFRFPKQDAPVYPGQMVDVYIGSK